MATDNNDQPVSKLYPNLKPWKPGVSPNPGGQPKGRRVSSWMAEYGEIPDSEWPRGAALKKLPGNAQIALKRLREALKGETLGLRNAEYVEPRATAQPAAESVSLPMLEAIAAAIMALKQAGVKPEPIDVTPSPQRLESERE